MSYLVSSCSYTNSQKSFERSFTDFNLSMFPRYSKHANIQGWLSFSIFISLQCSRLNYFLRRGEGNKVVALEDIFLWTNSWFLLRQPRPVWLLWRSLSLLAQNRNVLSRNLLFDFYPNDTVHKIFVTLKAVARLNFFGGWGWHLPSLLDTTYEPASNHCILLKKILFNELPVQN